MSDRNEIASLLRQHHFTRAITLANAILRSEPHNDDILGLQALALEGAGDIASAETAFRSALSNARDHAHQIRYASNFAALLIEQDRKADAITLLDQPWIWSEGSGAKPELLGAAYNLARLLHTLDLNDAALQFLRQIFKAPATNFDTLKLFVTILSERGFHEEAYQTVRNAAAPLHADEDYQALKAFTAGKSKRQQEAADAIKSYFSSHPVYLTRRPDAGKIGIVVINSTPKFDRILPNQFERHFHGNFPQQLARMFSKDYTFDSIFAFSRPEDVTLLPRDRPSLCLNNYVNAERLRSNSNVEKILKLETAIGLPVINSAAKAELCTRQWNAKRLENVSGVIVPKIQRYLMNKNKIGEVISSIEAEFTYPVIMRSTVEQTGSNMFLCQSTQELTSHLKDFERPELYIIEFVDNRYRGKYYKKLRAAFVDGHPIIVRCDISNYWKIHGRQIGGSFAERAIQIHDIYRQHPDILEHANSMISDPHLTLGETVMSRLTEIARHIPLDIFGLDFDVTEDKKIVFFEANATMNLFPWGDKIFPFPQIAVDRLSAQLRRFIEKKVAEPSSLARE